MKYIRTKDGVEEYKGSDKIIITATPEQIEYWQKHFKSVIEKSDWKLGDTIEELCDGYIIESKNNPAIWFEMTCEEFSRQKPNFNLWIIYAYIKTDKGLIYVAKMNEEGELCLL